MKKKTVRYGSGKRQNSNSPDRRSKKPSSSAGRKRTSSFGKKEEPSMYGSKEKPSSSTSRKKTSSFGKKEKPSMFGSKEKTSSSAGRKKTSSFGKKEKPSMFGSKEKPSSSAGRKKTSSFGKKEEPSMYGSKEKPSSSAGKKKSSSYSKKGKPTSPGKKGKGQLKSKKESTEIRLNKFLANTGLCSRREADEFIARGLVSINGKTVTELGTKVSRKDEVKFKEKKLVPEKKTYILLNKPKNVITTTEDPQGRKTVLSLIKRGPEERIYPVGRLDRMSTGVLLLTNDGEMTKRLTHPKYQKKKIYQVSLDKDLTKGDMQSIIDGVNLEDGLIKPDLISYVDEKDKREIGIEIHSGKNRIIRRLFEHLGYEVIRLDRVYFAGLTKKNLPRGRWRYLNDKEISILKRGSYE